VTLVPLPSCLRTTIVVSTPSSMNLAYPKSCCGFLPFSLPSESVALSAFARVYSPQEDHLSCFDRLNAEKTSRSFDCEAQLSGKLAVGGLL
jgi:hypothetical protein